MPKRSGEKRDFMQVAREVVEQAIGEHMDGTPLEKALDPQNPHFVALGSNGGKKRGLVRAQRLAAKRRPDIAEVVDKIGGGGWTRTNDLGIMRPSL